MRTPNATYAAVNGRLNAEPRLVIEVAFDSANTDLHYFTSHADCLLPAGASATLSCIESASSITQKIIPDQHRSEIGNFTFSLVDVAQAVSTLIRSKEAAGYGLRQKRVRIYHGYSDPTFTDFASYELVGTWQVDNLSYDNVAYSVSCADTTRSLRNQIFADVTTNITADVTVATDTVVNVLSTAGFSLVAHGTSYSDAPSQTVGYGFLGNMAFRFTGMTSTQFTGCTFGVLGTEAADVKVSTGSSADQQPKVLELIYLEMPAPKLALAILTGSLYNQAGDSLPSGWHLGIDPTYVNTSAFVDIGNDLWTPADDTQGVIARFVKEKAQDGKAFLESQVMPLIGCYMPVLSDASLSLRRRTSILADAAYVAVLNGSNTQAKTPLTHDMKKVHNLYQVNWNYDFVNDATTRTNLLIDTTSISVHGESLIMPLTLRGLSGYRFTGDMLYGMFNSLRDSYSGPPEEMPVNCLPQMNNLEVGDIVRVQLDSVADAAASGANSIDRSFEVQQVTIDWLKGSVQLQLFGSSEAAAPAPVGSASFPAAIYGQGTDLSAIPEMSLTGGVYHLTADYTLAGSAALGGVIAHVPGDFTIDAGVTLTVTGNLLLLVDGFLTVDGTINGKGQGIAGQALAAGAVSAGGSGTAGGLGSTQAGGGVELGSAVGGATETLISVAAPIVSGASAIPAITVGVDSTGTSLTGLPSDLRGCAGGYGGSFYDTLNVLSPGTDGAASGAGLCIVCKGGSYGASGKIDLSGDDSVAAAVGPTDAQMSGGSSGAGGSAGGLLVILDGANSLWTEAGGGFVAQHGATPATTGAVGVLSSASEAYDSSVYAAANYPATCYYPGIGAFDQSASNRRVIYAQSQQSPGGDLPTTTSAPTALNLQEYTNTPKSAAGDISSIEASVTPPADGTYSYSNIYYQLQGQTAWTLVGPTAPEAIAEVVSDGSTYNFQARAVSISGVESATGPTATITVTDITDPAWSQPPSDTLTVPNVTGLEIYNQASNTEFTGQDCKVTWRRTSASEWVDLGWEPAGIGGDAGTLDLYFDYWQVSVYDPADNLLRQENVTDNWYTYTLEKNAEDYAAVNGSPGSNRSFRFEVVIVSMQAMVSPRVAKLSVSNPAPAQLASLSVSPGFQTATVNGSPLTDLDGQGLMIWMSTVTGFAQDATTLIYKGPNYRVDLTGLIAGQQYYYRAAGFDAFIPTDQVDGTDLNVSPELTFTTQATIDSSTVAGLGAWATRTTPADAAFIAANLGNDAIVSDQIAGIVAAKIEAGTMAAKVAVAGVFTAAAAQSILNDDGSGLSPGDWRLDMGPVTVGATTYIQRFHDGNGNSKFSIDSLGNVVTAGSFTITGGSGIANLSDAGALATQSVVTWSSQVTGTGKPADNADVTNTALTTGTTITGGGVTISGGGAFKSYGMSNESPISGGGVWVGYNAISAKYTFSVGDTTSSIVWDGTDLLAQSLKTAASGQRFEINPAGDGLIHFYSGTASLETVIIGNDLVNGYQAYSFFGNQNDNIFHGLIGWSGSKNGLFGMSGSGSGVAGMSTSGSGVYAESTDAQGLEVVNGINMWGQTAYPTSSPAASSGALYIKGTYLVIQYNNGGTLGYKYTDLTSAAGWAFSTTPP